MHRAACTLAWFYSRSLSVPDAAAPHNRMAPVRRNCARPPPRPARWVTLTATNPAHLLPLPPPHLLRSVPEAAGSSRASPAPTVEGRSWQAASLATPEPSLHINAPSPSPPCPSLTSPSTLQQACSASRRRPAGSMSSSSSMDCASSKDKEAAADPPR
jgi:hypothetical protein